MGKNVVFGSYDGHILPLTSSRRNSNGPIQLKTSRLRPPEAKAEQPAEAPAAAADGAAPAGAEAAPAATPKPVVKPGKGLTYSRPLLTSSGLIVIGNLDGYVYAIDSKTGEYQWRFAADGAKPGLGVTSGVAEYDKLILAPTTRHLDKLSDQSVVWKVKAGDEINSSPVLDDKGILYCGSRDKNLYAIDAKTGEQKKITALQGPILAIPAVLRTWFS